MRISDWSSDVCSSDLCRSASADGLHALWLGPDEWLVLAAGSAAETMLQASERLAALGGACVDVSHRQVAITLDGPEADIWLASGCPLDLAISAFPAGERKVVVWGKRVSVSEGS